MLPLAWITEILQEKSRDTGLIKFSCNNYYLDVIHALQTTTTTYRLHIWPPVDAFALIVSRDTSNNEAV